MKATHSCRTEQNAVIGLDIDGDVLPMVLLMVIGTTRPGRWDDVSLSRLMDMRPSNIRAALIDLEDWGLIRPFGSNSWTATARGTRNIRINLPGKMPIA